MPRIHIDTSTLSLETKAEFALVLSLCSQLFCLCIKMCYCVQYPGMKEEQPPLC